MSTEPLGRRARRDDDAPNFTRYVGIVRERMEGGECAVRLPLRPEHFNLGGVVHGGVTAALLDSCMGGAVVSTLADPEWCATASLELKYLRWAAGKELRCDARVVKRGSALAFVEGRVQDAEGQEVARASGVWFIWDEGQRPRGPPEGA
ncbi:MAG: PaaI family thioesterase [Halobacteriales archaeon]|nr:PaaI family thioesterase [Halobacteriales archaeon]